MIDENDYSITEPAEGERNARSTRISARNRNLLIIVGTAVLLVIVALFLWPRHESANKKGNAAAESKEAEEDAKAGNEVVLSPATLTAAGIEIVGVTERPAVALLRVTGAVEPNQQQTQQVTPLMAGRVDRVNVVLGDHVRAGAVLAIVSSPEVAEMHGKLHEGETRLTLAEQNYARVQRTENRSSVLQAQARLDEAEATLRRTRRLIELGAGAGKDLVAAEAAHKSAKADYDYQSNISINREVQQARSEAEIARVEDLHLRNSLRALGAELSEDSNSKASHDTSLIRITCAFWYRPALTYVMENRKRSLAVAAALVIASGILFPFLGAEFIPRLEEGSLAVQIQRLPSVSLTESIAIATQVEKVLHSFPEVIKVVSKTGRAEVATDPESVDKSDVLVQLKPPAEWTIAHTREELVEKMAKKLEENVPTAIFSFSQPIELRVSELISGVRSDVAIKLFGDDLDTLKQKADQIVRVVNKIPGAEDVKAEQVSGLPQLQIEPDRAAIARYGINVEDVNNLVESIVAGKPAGLVYEGEQRFDLVVRLTDATSKDIDTIKDLLVPAPKGVRVPLSQLAEVSTVEGPAQISREDTRRRIVVELNVRGRDIASFVKEAQAAIEKQVEIPAGYYIRWGGQFESLERASARLLIVVPLALFLIFVLLFTMFNSIKQALLIYTSIPLAVVGGVFSLYLRGLPFSISAGVGFIALFGVAVLDGVVMVSYINQLRDQGRSLGQAVKEGADARLRPILMTALVASLGFVPMAIATSAGAEVQRPLATVVIGGLIVSTVLKLLLLPMLYGWFERDRVEY